MKILFVRNDKLGDFVLTLPVYRELKRLDPSAHISVLVSGYVAELAEHYPYIDTVLVDDKKCFWANIQAFRQQKFDTAIAIFSTSRNALQLLLAGIPNRIAPATKIAQIFYSKRLKQRRSQVKKTEFAYNLDLLHTLYPEAELTIKRPVLSINEAHRNDVHTLLNIAPEKKVIAFHPGFGGSSKGNLTLEEYIELARMTAATGSHEALFTFGPDESALMERTRALVDFPAHFYQSNEGLIRFCEVISGVSLFVSTSTGTMHLAGAVNIPTLSFFGEDLIASSKRWAPLNAPELQKNYELPVDETSRVDALAEIGKYMQHYLTR